MGFQRVSRNCVCGWPNKLFIVRRSNPQRQFTVAGGHHKINGQLVGQQEKQFFLF